MQRLSRTGIRTSYFAGYKGRHGVCIALYPPKWYTGECYPDLAPPKDLLNDFKAHKITREQYKLRYNRDVLDKLDPFKVYNDLKGKVLLCYENITKEDYYLGFCHRLLVAEWLESNLDVKVSEYGKENFRSL